MRNYQLQARLAEDACLIARHWYFFHAALERANTEIPMQAIRHMNGLAEAVREAEADFLEHREARMQADAIERDLMERGEAP